MQDKGLTAINIRSINQSKIYQAIYNAGSISKYQLVQTLEMGLSTVSSGLKELESAGLIKRDGYFDSTGGRRAQVIQIVPTARIAIGAAIQKRLVHLAAIDLYGKILFKDTIPFPFTPDEGYFRSVGLEIRAFINRNDIPSDRILGVSLAIRGIVSRDGLRVECGTAMGGASIELASFAEHIPFPCRLERDSKAAALLEQWTHPEIRNAVVFMLNSSIGGAIISNGAVQTGDHMRSGLIEHMCVQPDGPLCHCGKRGCLETFCSADQIRRKADMSISAFFTALREKTSGELQDIWYDYLDHLAFAMCNLNIILDSTFILSGFLAPYFTEGDIVGLVNRINGISTFPFFREQIVIGSHGQYSAAAGGALHYIKEFLASV